LEINLSLEVKEDGKHVYIVTSFIILMKQRNKIVNLVGFFVLPLCRKVAKDTDMYYNNHFVLVHDLLRELAIHLSKEKTFEQRERVMIELNGDNRPEWWVRLNPLGIIGRSFSYILGMLYTQKQPKVAARILSISTGMFLSVQTIANAHT